MGPAIAGLDGKLLMDSSEENSGHARRGKKILGFR
jgi:hypothetical protein